MDTILRAFTTDPKLAVMQLLGLVVLIVLLVNVARRTKN